MTRNFIVPSQKEHSLVQKPLAIVGVVLLAILASPLLDPLTRARVFTGVFLGGGLGRWAEIRLLRQPVNRPAKQRERQSVHSE